MAGKIIYIRMFVYMLTVGMHVSNMIYAGLTSNYIALELNDPRITSYRNLQTRFLTCWTFFHQVVHAVIGLVCDYLILKNSGKNYKLPKHLKGFKNVLFCTIVWPTTWTVFIVFWTVYYYDRSLIYPEFVDKFLTPLSNHIMHTFIVPLSILEVFLQPKTEPKSHIRNIAHLTLYLALYFSVLMYTYFERNIWIYRMFGVYYGTNYFLVLPLSIYLLTVIIYYLQWPLTSFIRPKYAKEKKIR